MADPLLSEPTSPPSEGQVPEGIQDGLDYERLCYASGQPCTDASFYNAPPDSASAKPGAVLKVETGTDASRYLLPPGTALSRIIYQSETFNGNPVPVSAFILWPYTATPQPDGGYPVVAWAHGTSGILADGAPSNQKNLWQHFLGPYQLALQGYVVVATDYAGLGVSKDVSGEPIVHEYVAAPAHANDVVYSVLAARAAFPELSKSWVATGHSQGGMAVWAVAERQVKKPVDGYLGAVPVSPPTRIIDEPGELSAVLGWTIAPVIAATDPEFDLEDVLTAEGLQAWSMVRKIRTGMVTSLALLMGMLKSGVTLTKPDWKQNKHMVDFQERAQVGRKPFAGPMLVVFGEADPRLSIDIATKTVEETANAFPKSNLIYVTLPEVMHNGALTAGLKISADWIADRFRGVKAEGGYQRSKITPLRPAASYVKEQNWFLAPATDYYHVP